DQSGKFVGCLFQGDLFPDEPIFCPGEDKSEFIRKEVNQMPVHFLVDQNERILGIQIIKHRSAMRICDIQPSLATQEQRDRVEAKKIKAPIGRWPNSREEFEILLEKIEEKLQSNEVPVRARPFAALEEASKILNKPLNLAPSKDLANTDTYSGDAFSWHVHQWYIKRYSDKLSLGPLGIFGVNLRGEFWEGKLPHIFGTIQVFVHRTEQSSEGRYNLLDCIKNLPQDLRYQLSDVELLGIKEIANFAFVTYLSLERLSKYDLAEAARSDLHLCVSNLTEAHPHFGQARWSALQAVEKIMKLALKVSGAEIPHSHDLILLYKKINATGFSLQNPHLLDQVRCVVGVRYGETPSTRKEAGDANLSAFAICAEVSEQIVKKINVTQKKS
ncbi:MAG: hypothetical protein SFY68_14845, partial [Candidatus Sumerlaeia bacterium]|nr:hypothetical protein [Candidatus Sumerlaeia bacterium]